MVMVPSGLVGHHAEPCVDLDGDEAGYGHRWRTSSSSGGRAFTAVQAHPPFPHTTQGTRTEGRGGPLVDAPPPPPPPTKAQGGGPDIPSCPRHPPWVVCSSTNLSLSAHHTVPSRNRAFSYRQDHAHIERDSNTRASPHPQHPHPSPSSPSGLRGLAKRAASLAGLSYSANPAEPQAPPPPVLTEGFKSPLARARRQEKQRHSGVWITPSPSGLRPIGLGLAADPHSSYGVGASPSHSRNSSVSSNASQRAFSFRSESGTSTTQSAPAIVPTSFAQRPTPRATNPVVSPTPSASSSLSAVSPSVNFSKSRNTYTESPPSLWIRRDSTASSFSGLNSGGQTDSDDSDDKRDSLLSNPYKLHSSYSPVELYTAQQVMPPKSNGSGRAGGKSKAEVRRGKKDEADSALAANPTAANGDKKIDTKETGDSGSGNGSVAAVESEDSDGEGFEDAEGGAGEDRDTAVTGEEDDSPKDQTTVATDEEAALPPSPLPETSAENVAETTNKAQEAASPEPIVLPSSNEPAATTPLTARPPPPPPRPGPAAKTPNTPTPRKDSATSLWDRLKSPQERAAEAAAKSATSPTPAPAAPPMQQRQQSSGSLLDSLTSAANYAASSAASRGFSLPERLGGGPAAAASLAQTPAQRKRLPQYEVDEAKMMEDQMRFAEARHLLATSVELEQIRALGKDLESGWREKLAEVTEMHLRLEDLTANVSDIQDENEQLRTQLSSLSEQIALREEDFEAFQRLTIAHQEREKELWDGESKEERERLEWKEREAVRILAEERAINAQLRLVLLGSLNANGTVANGAASDRISSSGLVRKSASSESSNDRHANGSSAVFDATEGESSTAGEELERSGTRDSMYAPSNVGGGGGEEEGAIQDDVLFNLNLSHTANNVNGNGATSPSGTTTGGGRSMSQGLLTNRTAVASLFSDVVPLDQLRLILKLPAEEDEEAAQRILCDAPWTGGMGMSTSTSQHSLSMQAQAQPADMASTLSSSSLSSASLRYRLASHKSLADYQLSQALQLENLSLRAQLKDEARRSLAAKEEVRLLREKVRGMEEAVSGLLTEAGGFAALNSSLAAPALSSSGGGGGGRGGP